MNREELLKMIGNREIKFRVWDNISKTMNYCPNLLLSDNIGLNEQIEEFNQHQYHCIIMQFRQDIKPIHVDGFVGDIFQGKIREGDRFSNWGDWKDVYALITNVDQKIQFYDIETKLRIYINEWYIFSNFKLVGNIFENPQLLGN